MATVAQTTYRAGQGISNTWPDIRLTLEALGSALLFLFLVTQIPGLKLQTEFGEYFLALVVITFLLSVMIAAAVPFNWMVGLVFFGSIVVPLSEVTMTGAYNVVTTGLMFGAVFRIRPTKIQLTRI